MKANRQTQELNDKLCAIEEYYHTIIIKVALKHFNDIEYQELCGVIEKAKAWDVFRAKCSKGAKVASGNLSRKERIDRARKASHAKTIKADKEKARKELDRIKRGKTRTKTEHA